MVRCATRYVAEVPPLVLMTNVEAGTADEEAVTAATGVLEQLGEVVVRVMCDDTEMLAAVREAAGGTLVVAGGDGTLHLAVNALRRERLLGRMTLGVIPMGTGNDFARGTGIPLEPTDAAAVVVRALEETSGAPFWAVGVGPGREETIVLR